MLRFIQHPIIHASAFKSSESLLFNPVIGVPVIFLIAVKREVKA
jgi:hypothetical protein